MAPPTPTSGQPTQTVAELDEPSLNTLLTVEEAARRLSIGRTTMYALLKDSQINSVRIGRLRRIPSEALAVYTARLIAEQHAA
ncbi:MAG: helix-turn-helix domain-containing protein [Actinobacteria bacterium]|nr:helix-turn-helix domain-containing protein [Actinomycetota bacterium]